MAKKSKPNEKPVNPAGTTHQGLPKIGSPTKPSPHPKDDLELMKQRKLPANIYRPQAKPATKPAAKPAAKPSSISAESMLVETVPAPDSIAELARALKHNVDLIYEWVYSNVDFFPMYGLHKGAFGTMIDRSGGSFEQASLMVALLRESGYTANFVYELSRTRWLVHRSVPKKATT